MALPAAPAVVALRGVVPAEAWAKMGRDFEAEHARYVAAGELGRSVQGACRRGLLQFHLGDIEAAARSEAAALEALRAVPAEVMTPVPQRAAPVAHAVEAHAALCGTLAFVQTGRFPAFEEMAFAGIDEAEYVSGLLGASQELSRYATGRATAGDVDSVALARDAVEAVHAALLEFDFRNGPLRRQYDGLKYALRHLEDVLYEQSLVGRVVTVEAPAPEAEEEPCGIAQGPAVACLEAIRGHFDLHDAARECVIKMSRDVQKAAKQAIFALHRGDGAKAVKFLDEATAAARVVFEDPDLLQRWPALRAQGAFSGALEEWAEAALFKHWLDHVGAVAAPDALALELTNEEYLGGVADLTGEIGRYAVAAATKRHLREVQKVYATDLAVLEQLTTLALPPKLHKKVEPLQGALKKLETLLYELSLAQASAFMPSKRPLAGNDSSDTKKPRNKNDNDDDDDDNTRG